MTWLTKIRDRVARAKTLGIVTPIEMRDDSIQLLEVVEEQKKVLVSIRHMITTPNGPLYGILPSKFLDSLEKALKSTEES